MAELYADENFPYPVVAVLRRLGHDVLTAREDSRAGHDDDQILAAASAARRAVLTMDRRDFRRLHQSYTEHYGIVLCTADPDSDGQALRIHQAIGDASDLHGKLILIYRPSK